MSLPLSKPSIATSHTHLQQAVVPSKPVAAPATERMTDEAADAAADAAEAQRSSSDPSRGSHRRKRRKTQPYPSSDVYASEYSAEDKAGGPLARDFKDPHVVSAKQAFYEKLAAVLILDSGRSGTGDCVVLQKSKNENLIAMSPFRALLDHLPKHMRMPEGSFRVIVTAQFSDDQGYVAVNPSRQAFRLSPSHIPHSSPIPPHSSPAAARRRRNVGDLASTALK